MQSVSRREVVRGGLSLLLSVAALPLLAEPTRRRPRLALTPSRESGPFTSLIVDCQAPEVQWSPRHAVQPPTPQVAVPLE